MASSLPPQMDTNNLKLVADLEIEMMSDMYNRMTAACHKKCIAPKYRESDLSKGKVKTHTHRIYYGRIQFLTKIYPLFKNSQANRFVLIDV